eukprot:ANDGO_01609.mRNA.1 hypothetical protein
MVNDLSVAYRDTDGNLRKYTTDSRFRGNAWKLHTFNPLDYYETAASSKVIVMSVVQLVILIMLYIILGTSIAVSQWYGVLFLISIIVRLIMNVTVYNPAHIWFRRKRLLTYTGPMVSSYNVVEKQFLTFIYETYTRWIDWLPLVLAKSKLVRFLYSVWLVLFFIITLLTIILGMNNNDSSAKFLWIIVPFVDLGICASRMFGGVVEKDEGTFDLLGLYTVSKTVSYSTTAGSTTTTTTITTTYSDVQVYSLASVNPDPAYASASKAQIAADIEAPSQGPPDLNTTGTETGGAVQNPYIAPPADPVQQNPYVVPTNDPAPQAPGSVISAS